MSAIQTIGVAGICALAAIPLALVISLWGKK